MDIYTYTTYTAPVIISHRTPQFALLYPGEDRYHESEKRA
jgi:hypothetical protein